MERMKNDASRSTYSATLRRSLCVLFLRLIMALTACGMAGEQEEPDMSEQNITIAYTDLIDGVWNEEITNTKYGSNVFPQLPWNAVDGASCYADAYIAGRSAQAYNIRQFKGISPKA